MWWEIAKFALVALVFCWGVYLVFIRPKMAKKKIEANGENSVSETKTNTSTE